MTSERIRLVTVSASYGSGGAVVGPALAERLGVPFLQRATTSAGDVEGAHGVEGAQPHAERLTKGESELTPAHWLLACLSSAMPTGPTQSPPPVRHQDERMRRQCEEGIHALAAAGGGVILGRGAAVVLGKERGFHVRLDGPTERRVVQGATIEGIDESQARERLRAADKARTAYVRRLYRCDPADATLYHLVIDSTALPLDAVTELIVTAARAH